MEAQTAQKSPIATTEVAAVFLVGQPDGSLAVSVSDISGSNGVLMKAARSMAGTFKTMMSFSEESRSIVNKAIQTAAMMEHAKAAGSVKTPTPQASEQPH